MRNALLFLLLLSSFAFAISSSEALARVDPCIQGKYQDVRSLGKPVDVRGEYYWIFYYPIDSPKKIVVAVSDSEGEVVSDAYLLAAVGEAMYDYGVLSDYVVKQGWSAGTTASAVSASLDVIQTRLTYLETFQAQTMEKYPGLSFDAVYASLNELQANAQELYSVLEEAKSNQAYFESDYSAEYLALTISFYNSSFEKLYSFFAAYDEYGKAISGMEADVYKSSIPDPDNKNINSNLENLRDVGIGSLYGKARASDPRAWLAKLSASREAWVNDSVSSFSFEQARCKALQLYSDNKGLYDSTIASKQLLESYGLGDKVKKLQEDWRAIEYYKQQASLESYGKMVTEIPVAATLMVSIKEEYAAKTSGTPTDSPQPKKGVDFASIVIVLIVAGLAVYGFMQYKKKRDAESESEE